MVSFVAGVGYRGHHRRRRNEETVVCDTTICDATTGDRSERVGSSSVPVLRHVRTVRIVRLGLLFLLLLSLFSLLSLSSLFSLGQHVCSHSRACPCNTFFLRFAVQDQSGDIHYLEFLAATIEAVGATEVQQFMKKSVNSSCVLRACSPLNWRKRACSRVAYLV